MTSKLVVSSLIGLGLLTATFMIFGLKVGLLLCLVLAYEGFTLVNKEPKDTISETLWKLSNRPLVPWLFGLAFGWALGSGLLNNPYHSAVAAYLNAHFFFQAQFVYETYANLLKAKS